ETIFLLLIYREIKKNLMVTQLFKTISDHSFKTYLKLGLTTTLSNQGIELITRLKQTACSF
ncbi:MAG: hypothetical protein MRQ09_06970, partial [Candidatus Midichloria sp.]|nr:hypothetical protein [Candidatus Midichloria sp.]